MLSNNPQNRKDFEEKYGQGGLAAFDNESFENDNDQVDANGRVTKGPLTLKNGATYTGQWLQNMRDGVGSQLWPDGSKYDGQWANDKANG